MGVVKGVICHHTAGAATGDHPSLELIEKGRVDLAGPLSQLFLARDGTFYVIAAGRCNHAGAGLWHGVTAGNSQMIGIEAENKGDGKDPWTPEQLEAYPKGVAALLAYIHADSSMAAGHKEYALPRGRKVDPSFDMIDFREHVDAYMQSAGMPTRPLLKPIAAADPARSMLRKGDQGNSVRQLQQLLGITVDGSFGPTTDAAVRAFQTKHTLMADGLVGPKTWAELGITNAEPAAQAA
jgi:N-acetyl-anhydromuramyl-L-alanine amidase AmpD